jgi:hypothetical protein
VIKPEAVETPETTPERYETRVWMLRVPVTVEVVEISPEMYGIAAGIDTVPETVEVAAVVPDNAVVALILPCTVLVEAI